MAFEFTTAPQGGCRVNGRTYQEGESVRVDDLQALQKHMYRRERIEGGVDLVSQRGGVGKRSERLLDHSNKFPLAAPNFGRSVLPHVMTFRGVMTTLSKAYRYSDAAMRDSIENSHMMLNDPMIMGPLFIRMRMVALLNWSIEPGDDQDQKEVSLAKEMTEILKRTPWFTKYLETLGFATWFGRYGIQNKYKVHVKNGRKSYIIGGWVPISGDKILFRYDDGSGQYDPNQIGVKVTPALAKRDYIAGNRRLEASADGLGYFLEPWERSRISLHRHVIMDGEFEDPNSGGFIHGVGARSFLYWTWYQKQETLQQIAELTERNASGFTIYWYPMHNPNAQAEVEKIAEKQAHTHVITMPFDSSDPDAYRIEQIPANTAGVSVLQDLIERHFQHLILRFILGQTLSVESAATGLGSGVADLHKDSLYNMIKYDAVGMEETITRELVSPLRDFNFPKLRNADIYFRLSTEASDPASMIAAAQALYMMGADLKTSDLFDMVGLSQPGPEDDRIYMPELIAQRMSFEQQMEQGEQQQAGGEMMQLPGPQEGAPMPPDNQEFAKEERNRPEHGPIMYESEEQEGPHGYGVYDIAKDRGAPEPGNKHVYHIRPVGQPLSSGLDPLEVYEDPQHMNDIGMQLPRTGRSQISIFEVPDNLILRGDRSAQIDPSAIRREHFNIPFETPGQMNVHAQAGKLGDYVLEAQRRHDSSVAMSEKILGRGDGFEGFTYHPIQDFSPRRGWAVSPHKDQEDIHPSPYDRSEVNTPDDILPKDYQDTYKAIFNYLGLHWHRFKEDSQLYAGGWEARENNDPNNPLQQWYDLAIVVPGWAEAYQNAVKFDQEGVFNLETFKTYLVKNYPEGKSPEDEPESEPEAQQNSHEAENPGPQRARRTRPSNGEADAGSTAGNDKSIQRKKGQPKRHGVATADRSHHMVPYQADDDDLHAMFDTKIKYAEDDDELDFGLDDDGGPEDDQPPMPEPDGSEGRGGDDWLDDVEDANEEQVLDLSSDMSPEDVLAQSTWEEKRKREFDENNVEGITPDDIAQSEQAAVDSGKPAEVGGGEEQEAVQPGQEPPEDPIQGAIQSGAEQAAQAQGTPIPSVPSGAPDPTIGQPESTATQGIPAPEGRAEEEGMGQIPEKPPTSPGAKPSAESVEDIRMQAEGIQNEISEIKKAYQEAQRRGDDVQPHIDQYKEKQKELRDLAYKESGLEKESTKVDGTEPNSVIDIADQIQNGTADFNDPNTRQAYINNSEEIEKELKKRSGTDVPESAADAVHPDRAEDIPAEEQTVADEELNPPLDSINHKNWDLTNRDGYADALQDWAYAKYGVYPDVNQMAAEGTLQSLTDEFDEYADKLGWEREEDGWSVKREEPPIEAEEVPEEPGEDPAFTEHDMRKKFSDAPAGTTIGGWTKIDDPTMGEFWKHKDTDDAATNDSLMEKLSPEEVQAGFNTQSGSEPHHEDVARMFGHDVKGMDPAQVDRYMTGMASHLGYQPEGNSPQEMAADSARWLTSMHPAISQSILDASQLGFKPDPKMGTIPNAASAWNYVIRQAEAKGYKRQNGDTLSDINGAVDYLGRLPSGYGRDLVVFWRKHPNISKALAIGAAMWFSVWLLRKSVGGMMSATDAVFGGMTGAGRFRKAGLPRRFRKVGYPFKYEDTYEFGNTEENEPETHEMDKFGLSHRRSDGKHPKETGQVVLFTEDKEANSNYGDDEWELNLDGRVQDVPNWVFDWYSKKMGISKEDSIKEVSPENIVNSAGMWDDSQIVSDFWHENEDRLIKEGAAGYKTPDGAVVFDSHSAEMRKAVNPEENEPETYEKESGFGGIFPSQLQTEHDIGSGAGVIYAVHPGGGRGHKHPFSSKHGNFLQAHSAAEQDAMQLNSGMQRHVKMERDFKTYPYEKEEGEKEGEPIRYAELEDLHGTPAVFLGGQGYRDWLNVGHHKGNLWNWYQGDLDVQPVKKGSTHETLWGKDSGQYHRLSHGYSGRYDPEKKTATLMAAMAIERQPVPKRVMSSLQKTFPDMQQVRVYDHGWYPVTKHHQHIPYPNGERPPSNPKAQQPDPSTTQGVFG